MIFKHITVNKISLNVDRPIVLDLCIFCVQYNLCRPTFVPSFLPIIVVIIIIIIIINIIIIIFYGQGLHACSNSELTSEIINLVDVGSARSEVSTRIEQHDTQEHGHTHTQCLDCDSNP
jgi:hypothetical protein